MQRRVHVCVFAMVACIALLVTPGAQAASLSTKIYPHKRSCFHSWVDQVHEKVGFYFAVQEGGDFDIDYSIVAPSDKVILEGKKSSQEDFVFTANEFGEYTFCFDNVGNSKEDKMVDFDITVESEPRSELPITKAALLADKSTPVENSMSKLDSDLAAIERTLRFFRMRENQGFSLVELTKQRILRFSILEMLAIVGISVGQVAFVRFLFDRSGGTRYSV